MAMMVTDKNNRYSLEKFREDEGHDTMGTDAELAEAMDLLYDVMNASYASSGTPLEIDRNGQRESIQGLYWKCKELLDKANKNPEKTGFLAMSILEQTWSLARQIALCPLSDMLDGDMSMLEKARRLEKILADNEYKKIWAEKAGTYAAILSSIGFEPDPEAFQDLTKIMDPLLDALTFYEPKKFGTCARIYEVRHGAVSQDRRPGIARAICMYRSEKELVDAVMGAGRDCLMAFGAVEKTHAQVKDYFSDWFNGYPEERQRNMMHNENMTAEEYLASPCDYTRAVYLCIKSGARCWLIHMPWNGDSYSRIGDEKHEFYYGKRASYAPYQIFYKNAAPAPEGSTMLAVRKTGYLLSELMDPMCMAWYPAFLDETMKIFFGKSGGTPEAADLVFAEETAAADPTEKDAGKYAVVPVYSGVPAMCSWTYGIRTPQEIFAGDADALLLMDRFQVTAESIRGVPILPEKNGSPDAMRSEADKRLEKAYLKILSEKIAGFLLDRWDVRRWIVPRLDGNIRSVLEAGGAGDLMAFMTVTVDGTPVFNPDGTPKMVKRGRYPWDEIQDTIKTEPSDGRGETGRNRYQNFAKTVYWVSKPTSGRPPVVWALRPSEAAHYAAMAGCGESDLPEILRLSGPLSRFYAAHKDHVPQNLANRYAAMGYGTEKLSIAVPCFAAVNICMTKKEHRSFPYFMPDGKKKP